MTPVALFTAWWNTRRTRRAAADAHLVVIILRCVPDLTGRELARRTGLTPARMYQAVEHLERERRLARFWQDGTWRFSLTEVTA